MELMIIILLLIFSALISILIKRPRIMEFLSIVSSATAFIGSILIALKVVKFGYYKASVLFSVDSLGALIMLIVSFIGLSVVIYSISYLRKEFTGGIIGPHRVKQYFVLLNLFLAAMFLAVSTSNPVFAWIAIEATTLSTAFLISFYNRPSAMEAAWKYLIVNSVGLLLGFSGTLLYFISLSNSGDFGLATWDTLGKSIASVDPLIAKIAFILVLIGYGTKVGFVPMHTWKPDAYSKTPAPLGALFSGALLPVAFYIILKFKVITDLAVGPTFGQNLLIIFGLLSIAIPAFILLTLKDYKRLLAYSSIENAGITALGFGFGGLGATAATLHLIYHSLIKSALFFLSGNFLLKYHSAKIFNIKGALTVLTTTSILFITGFLAITGMPPFGIFFTKLSIFSAGIQDHFTVSVMALSLTILVFIGFFKHVSAMVFGEKPIGLTTEKENFWLLFSPALLIILALCLSFYQPHILQVLINNAILHY